MGRMIKYEAAHSLFHRLDPLSKIVWLLCLSILSLYYVDFVKQAVLLIVIMFIAFAAVRMTPIKLWRMMRLPLIVGLPYFAIQLIFYPGVTPWIHIGSFVITYESLNFAGAIVLRLLILVLISMLYITSTDPQDLVLALAQKLHLPYRFAFAISLALRFIPILEEEAKLIRDAQRLRGRGQPSGLWGKVIWQVRFMKAVFLNAVRRVEQLALMMELKGFGRYAKRTYRRLITISAAGRIVAIASVLLTILSIMI